jgi:hypothetical protein
MVSMCSDGDWMNCRDLADPRAEQLMRAACLYGESFACEFSTSIESKEFACTSMGLECDHWLQLVGDNPLKVREVLEHSCQWKNDDDCARLVRDYRAHAYPEPFAGRADALQRYLCAHDAERCAALKSE